MKKFKRNLIYKNFEIAFKTQTHYYVVLII